MKRIYFASWYFRVCDLTREIRVNKNPRGNFYLYSICFTIFSPDIMNQKQEENISNLICQSYSWNKGGPKVILLSRI